MAGPPGNRCLRTVPSAPRRPTPARGQSARHPSRPQPRLAARATCGTSPLGRTFDCGSRAHRRGHAARPGKGSLLVSNLRGDPAGCPRRVRRSSCHTRRARPPGKGRSTLPRPAPRQLDEVSAPSGDLPAISKAPVPVVRHRGCAVPGPQPTIGLPRAPHDARPEPVDLVRRELHAANLDAVTDILGAVLAVVLSGQRRGWSPGG